MTVDDNDLLQARVFFDMPEQVISECTFAYKADLAAPQTDATVLAAIDAQMDDMWTNLVTQITEDVQLDHMELREMAWVTDVWEVVRHIGESIPGVTFTSIVEMLPHAVAPYITADTLIPKTRGRKFIPGFTEAQQVDSVLIAGAVTALAAFALDYIGTISIDGSNFLIPVVLSVVDGLARNLTSTNVSDIVGSQRRRKPGVGI